MSDIETKLREAIDDMTPGPWASDYAEVSRLADEAIDTIAALRKQVSDAVGALEAAREFIADEYRDDRYAPDGEWLAPEARSLHNRLCEAIATLTGGKAE